jgi:acetoacetyl-CoA synthetase
LGDRVLDDDLRARISDELLVHASRRHVPDAILQVAAIPHTRTGKKLEVPVKRILQGVDPEQVVSRDAIDDPTLLEHFEKIDVPKTKALPTDSH